MAKEKTLEEIKAERKVAKGKVLKRYREVQAAEAVLTDVMKEGSADIAALVKAHGPGPHKYREPDGRIFYLEFRKSGDLYAIKRTEQDTSDDDDIPAEGAEDRDGTTS